MANVRDSDISLWLHNKLGTSNDSWISGSITSQLNKEVLRNIKECFPDLQTQVKLKLLLSFFQIPRRIVEEWKTELEEVIEVAGLDSELWVSMIAETIKTLPTTGSLNTEISDYEETRPIFTDMVNELRRLVVKNADLGMLPLECQYLNKSALVSVVGQQTTPVKHFTLKRKPKSAALRAELLQKSSDAQSCLKKISAPTVPLRSRGIPRKMTDTTPLKGIPSRVPTGGFRSPPTTPGQTRPTMSRTPAGRKDGGIKLLEIGEQPLGYAAAKKRKREQEKEEQAKKVAEQQSQSANDTKPVAAAPATSSPTAVTTTPDYAAGLSAPSTVYSQPATPLPATSGSKEGSSAGIMSTSVASNSSQTQVQQSPQQQQQQQQQTSPTQQTQLQPAQRQQSQTVTASQPSQQQTSVTTATADGDEDEEEVEMKEMKKETISLTSPTSIAVSSVPSVVSSAPPPLAYPTTKTLSATVIKTEAVATGNSMVALSSQPPSLVRTVPLTPKQAKSVLQTQAGTTGGVQIIQKSTGKTISAAAAAAAAVTSTSNTNAQQKIEIISSESIVPGTLHASIPKSTTIINRGGNILFTTKQVQPGTTSAAGGATIIQQKTPLTSFVLNTASPGKQLNIQRIVSSVSSASTPSLTTTISRAQNPQQLLQQQQQQPQQIQMQGQQTAAGQSTRIVQIKTAPTMSLNNNQLMQNIPPLISTQMPGGTAQPTILNIQSMQQQQQQQGQQNQLQITPTAVPQKRTITITAQNPATAGMTTSVAQILQQQQQQQQQQALQATAAAAVGQQPKYTQVVVPPNVKGNTFYVTNAANVSNVLNQKGVIIQTVDASGNTVYQQIPLQNMSGLSGATILTGPPGLIKTESDSKLSQIPALVPTSSLHQNIPALTPVVIQPSGGQQQGTTVVQQQQQQQQQQGATIPALITNITQQQVQQQQQQVKQQVIFRPVGGTNNVQTILPQGITLIQRPGGQPKLVQTIQQSAGGGVQQQQLIKTTTTAGQPGQRTIITQIPPQQQQQQQAQQQHTIQFQAPGSQRTGGTTIQLVQQPQQQGQAQQIQVQRTQLKQVTTQQQGTTVTIQQQSQGSGQQQQQQAQQAQQQQAGARKGLSISSKYYMEAHDMFKRANCVSRLEKAIIIGFMAGYRNNPRPSPENVVTIKLNESVEKVHQDDRSTLMLVESFITLDYNTGQWRTFRKYREIDQTQQLPEGVSGDTTTTTGTANTPSNGGSGAASNAGQQNSVVI
uniref:HDAg domain-containing protein n=1 Tax=Anopheles epiroticus TaxID=199890 RepID=A0A182PEH6_9DIPT